MIENILMGVLLVIAIFGVYLSWKKLSKKKEDKDDWEYDFSDFDEDLYSFMAESNPTSEKKTVFKAGDKVKNIETGEIDTVMAVPGMEEYDDKGFLSAEQGFVLKNNCWQFQEWWTLVTKNSTPKKKTVKKATKKVAKKAANKKSK